MNPNTQFPVYTTSWYMDIQCTCSQHRKRLCITFQLVHNTTAPYLDPLEYRYILASVPGLQTRKGGRPGTHCTCICAHAPNIPDILPYNSVNQCTDEKHGVNIRCLRFCGFVNARVSWQYGYYTDAWLQPLLQYSGLLRTRLLSPSDTEISY